MIDPAKIDFLTLRGYSVQPHSTLPARFQIVLPKSVDVKAAPLKADESFGSETLAWQRAQQIYASLIRL